MTSELDQILSKYTSSTKEDGSLLGVSFQVRGMGGKSIYAGSAGRLNSDTDAAFDEHAVCEIASMTKLVTAVAVMQVVEKGLVGVDDDVGRIVPELSDLDVLEGFDSNGQPMLGKQSKPMTLRVLLTHSSGFGYDVFDPDLMRWRAAIKSDLNFASYTLESLKIPLIFQPGDGWSYGIGIDWAGLVVQKLTGVPLGQYMQENIFTPLGMKSTTFRIAEHPELQPRRAEISARSEPRAPLTPSAAFKPDTIELDFGGVGLYSTASDYARLLGALLDDGKDILSATSVRKLCVPQLPDSKHLEAHFYGFMHYIFCPEYPKGSKVNYALGGAVNLEDIPEKRRAGSIMWSGATNPRWWFDPRSGIAATLVVQNMPPGDVVVSELYDELERAAGKFIDEDVAVSVPTYTLLRDASAFDKPEELNSDHWTTGDSEKMSKAHLSFSTGPRACIGRNIAYFEQLLVVGTLVRLYDFEFELENFELQTLERFNSNPGEMVVSCRRRCI